MLKTLIVGCFSAGVLLTGAGTTVSAADVGLPRKPPTFGTPAPVVDTWTLAVTPYAWAISLSGSSTVRGRTVDVNAGFFDILDHTQIPKGLLELSALSELRYGRFGLITDLAYTKLALGASLSRSRGVDRLNASVGASLGLTVEMFIAEFAAAYEIARWDSFAGPSTSTAVDLYAGGRAWWQKAEAELAIGGTLNVSDLSRSASGNLSATGDVSWVDPVVGARLRHRFAPKWDLAVSGDVGGFGVGSKFSWQALATLNYEIFRNQSVVWSGMLGYKALYVDYEKGSGLSDYEFKMTMHGPIMGLTARF